MASAQDKQKQYANQIVRKNNEHFILGDNVLLSTNTHAKHAISVLHGGTTKLLPRFIGPFTIEEVRDLNYRLSLPPYMKTHPVIFRGFTTIYVDPQEITYPHWPNVSDHVDDHATKNGTGEGTASIEHCQPISDPHPF